MTHMDEMLPGRHFDDAPAPDEPLARVEMDRFCGGCGYNLRTLLVTCESRTGIPVVRCTECGQFQSANDASTVLRPWLDRVTTVLVVGWLLVLVAVFVNLAVIQGAVSYATLDEFTSWGGRVAVPTSQGSTIVWQNSASPVVVKTDYKDSELFVTQILIASACAAFAIGMFMVVAFPHWRRLAYLVVTISLPIAIGGIIVAIWHEEAPHLMEWGQPYIAAHVGVQLAGGLVGMTLGRRLARLAVCILLPSSLRPKLAYLWLVDNKPFPKP